MKRTLPYLLIGVQLLFQFQLNAQSSKLKSGKEPAWITINNSDYNNKKLEAEAEDGYLDLSFEKQVSLGQQSRYYKKVLKILSEAGVQNSSEISVNFDPAYEQLIFHSIRIIRDGKSLNKLQLSNFKTIQQEKDLSRHMYDGSLTALLVLDDVRKGDIIETSYTIKGFNPIFNNKYTDVYDFSYAVPVASLYYKLLVPAGRNIITKNSKTDIMPTKTNWQDQTVYEWKANNVAAMHLEKKTPAWYDPFASVMLSEFKNWNEVSDWANTLFPRNIEISTSLQERINTIRKNNATPEARTLAALHFVQDDIRYMGIEMGVSSHKPSNPNKIFAQRFGDCKDKSYLLVTILNAMGIEANPVLINTGAKRTIKERLPSTSAFDHCTVQATVNGKVYWFDPTISFQRGAIGDIAYPDYQTGLVINEATKDFTDIPFHQPGFIDIKEIFTIPDMSGLAHFKVITKTTGSFADDARSDYNNNSVYEMKNKYKDFYAAYFDKIAADSLTYGSNDVTGDFTTTEYYTIKDIWKSEEGLKKIALSSYVINSVMTRPSDKNRNMPFYLTYPARYKEQIEINMPEDWPVREYDQRVDCAGFKLHATAGASGNKVSLNYEYENLKDHILPAEAASFFSSYEEAYAATGYELTYRPGNTYSYNTPGTVGLPQLGLFPKLYILLGTAVLITLIVKQRQKGY